MKRLLIAAAALALAACSSMPSWMPGGGWTTLIDGDKGLDNFTRVGDANWRAEGGAIVADRAKENSYLVSKDSYKDFVIHAEFYAEKTTNSGVFLRLQDRKKVGSVNAYEVNVYDLRPGQEYATGAIVDVAKIPVPVPAAYKAADKWNTFEITAKGDQLTVVFNGTRTVDVKNAKFGEGPFALQFGLHGKDAGGAIKWRKVQIKPL